MIRSLTVDKTPKPHKRDVFNVCGAYSCFLFFREVGNRQATDLLIGGSHLAWLAFSGSRSPCGIPLFHEGYPSDGYGYRKAGNRCHLLGLLSFREAWTVYQRLYRNCQFLFQNTEDQERNEAGHEVRFNPVIPLHVYRPRIKVVLYDAEGFFDFPSSLIHTNNFFHICFKIRADCIEAIKLGFLRADRGKCPLSRAGN